MDTIKIYRSFSVQTKYGKFDDALSFPSIEDYQSKTAEEIQAMKDERVNNFIEMRENPIVEIEPTEEQLQQQLIDLENQKLQIEEIKSSLTTKIQEVQALKISIAPIKE
jgi:hypothetical protein